MKSLEEALNYISQLESENKVLREEVERYRSIKPAGEKSMMRHGPLFTMILL